MLFLMKIVKFSASIMTGLWVRAGGLSALGRRGETGGAFTPGTTFLGASPSGHCPPWEWTVLGVPRDAERPLLAEQSWGGSSSRLPSSGPYISTVSTSVGHQPWISQVRSSEL